MTRTGIWRRLWVVAKPYWTGDKKWQAIGLLVVLLAFLGLVNYLNITLTSANGAVMTALQKKDAASFWPSLKYIVLVFAGGSVIVIVYAWIRARLAIHWRQWLTRHLLAKYFHDRAYYRINGRSDIDNPDERLHQDVEAFTGSLLGLFLSLLDAIITLASFSIILWRISDLLSYAAIAYALVGSVITFIIGRRLIKLNANQLRFEADFRYGLIHIRNNTEPIAFYRGEKRESEQVLGRFETAIQNLLKLVGWQRNVGFFTKFYTYMDFAIPMVIIAPLYFAGTVELGVITQASMAFGMVLGALSIFVNEFTGISKFAAIVNRLGAFDEAIDEPALDPDEEKIEVKRGDRLGLDKVTVQIPRGGRVLVADVTAESAADKPLLIVGPSGSGKSSVLRVLGGLWENGNGVVTRPDEKDIFFLPQRPYMILGTLRDQITYPNEDWNGSDEELQELMTRVGLPNFAAEHGGFDTVATWSDVPSQGEQQRLAFARLLLTKPKFVIIDEATSALDVKNEAKLYGLLRDSGVTFVSVGHRPTLLAYHKQVLELVGDGTWHIHTAEEYAEKLRQQQENGDS